jgi:hypothetical protein
MMRWIAGLAAALLLPACGGGGNSDHRSDPAGTPGDGVGAGRPASQPPTIRLIGPASGAAAPEGSTLTLQAELSDPNASVARVDFYEDNRRIGGASNPPYTLSYGPLRAGAPQLCAVAVDADGNAIVASDAITLFVVRGDDDRHGHDRKH